MTKSTSTRLAAGFSSAPTSLTKSTSSWLAAGFSVDVSARADSLPSQVGLGSPESERSPAVAVSGAGPSQQQLAQPGKPEDLLASWRREWLDVRRPEPPPKPDVLREIERPRPSPGSALPRANTTSVLVAASSVPLPARRARRRAHSDTPAPLQHLASSIPEWRKEGLGREMLEALERIERDSPQPHEPAVGRKPRNLGSIGSRLFGGGGRARANAGASRDGRSAERRREQERARPEVGCDISAPFEVTHSLYHLNTRCGSVRGGGSAVLKVL